MKIASVAEIQKNFGKVLSDLVSGEEIIITKRDNPIARIESLGPKSEIEWPDFFGEAIELEGKPLSEPGQLRCEPVRNALCPRSAPVGRNPVLPDRLPVRGNLDHPFLV